MNVAEFHDELSRDHDPTPDQLQVVDSLLELYADHELLLGGVDEPLNDVCLHCGPCWHGSTPRTGADGGISVPWVGPEYAAWRICVIGINFDNGGGLAEHWRVCADHIRVMRAGGQGKNERFFATGAMSYALAVQLSMAGSLPDPWVEPAPEQLAATWDRCAFLQAVKCAPDGDRSQPTDTMCHTCPPFLLVDELDMLAPRVVILLGRDALRDVARPMLMVAWGESRGHVERDTFHLGSGRAVELFSCNHPAGKNRTHWRQSLEQLIDSLRAKPLC